MHNGGDATIAALPQIVAALRARGFGFVRISELTKALPPLPRETASP